MTSMHRALNTTAAITLLWVSGAGPTQPDWLERGQELLGGFDNGAVTSSALSNQDIAAGLKEALSVGVDKVVAQLGTPGGFNDDPAVHIPLPESLKTVQATLDKLGMGAMLNDLDLRLNRAAEAAMPKTKQLFIEAISAMSLKDAKGILNGPPDAATRYFQAKMTPELKKEMRPVVDTTLAQVGAIESYDQAMDQYKSIPFVPDVKGNLTDYVVEQASDGLFHYLAVEEAAIRKDPAQRTTDLLKKVFGSP